jgi:hypothetical protein
MQQAKMKGQHQRVTIKDLVCGEEAWVVSHAFWVDEWEDVWIRGDYNFSHKKIGTSEIEIKMGGTHVLVDPNSLPPDYEPAPLPPGIPWIPVAWM